MIRKFTSHSTSLLCGLVFAFGGAGSAAATCPGNLTALTGQIQTPGLSARLDEPLDDIVARAGSLQAAINRTEAALAALKARRITVQAGSQSAQTIDDGILIFEAQLAALRCRQ